MESTFDEIGFLLDLQRLLQEATDLDNEFENDSIRILERALEANDLNDVTLPSIFLMCADQWEQDWYGVQYPVLFAIVQELLDSDDAGASMADLDEGAATLRRKVVNVVKRLGPQEDGAFQPASDALVNTCLIKNNRATIHTPPDENGRQYAVPAFIALYDIGLPQD